ncbi:MAG: hypothetical protein ACXVX9_00030 [Mycobacteriaceae bacterium]
MALRWLAVNMVDGSIICRLPSAAVSGPLRRTIGRYETMSATLQVTSKTSPSWPAAVVPYQAMWVAYDGPAGAEHPLWGGIVTGTPTRNLGNTLEVSLATPEVYLDRRYVGFYDAVGRDSNLIVTDLVSQFAGALPGLPGSFGMPLSTRTIGTGTLMDRHYRPDGDTTIYSALGDIAAQKGGPQWMVTLNWARNPDRITPVLTVAPKLGTRALPGMAPSVRFTPRMLTDVTYSVDYTNGNGANYVTAVGSGQGSTRPQQVSPATGSWDQPQRPVVEYRYTPALSIGDIGFLQSHADAARALLANGTGSVAMTVATAAVGAPLLGKDWELGDDIGYTLTGPTFPTPLTGAAQCIGVDITPTTVRPYLYTGVIY